LPRFGPVLPGATKPAMSAEVPKCPSYGHFGTSADMSGQFGTGLTDTSAPVPKCLGSEVS